MIKLEKLSFLIIAVLVMIQYSNTLTLGYTLDDRMIIYNNVYTVQGFAGVGKVFTTDSFSGFFIDESNLVAGGRYRPLAQLTFIIEYEIFGGNLKELINSPQATENEQIFMNAHLTFVSHLNNLLLYLLIIWIVYLVLLKLFPVNKNAKWYFSIPFLATLIFALHPLHTEAVTNIKGRDEIMAMLGAILFIFCILKYIDKRKILYLFFAFLAMLFAIFSKENAITFLAIAPLTLFFYHIPKKRADWGITLIPALVAIVIFLIFRTYALGAFMPEDTSNNILNNPFLGSSTAQKIATVIFTWGIYLKLLIFPHPLTHDYYPKQVEILNFSSPMVILLMLFFIFILFYAVKNLKKKNIVSFGILFFIITFSVVSNLFFCVGTFANERFLFISLLGFSVILAFYIQKFSTQKKGTLFVPVFLTILFSGYMLKGFTRNFAWKNNFTLSTTDIKNSSNSIKCNVFAGGEYFSQYKKSKKEFDLNQAFKYLNKAVKLDNNNYYANAFLGEAYHLNEDDEHACQYFENAIRIRPNDKEAQTNLMVVKHDKTIKDAEDKLLAGNSKEALELINQYLSANTPTARAYNFKGKIYGMGMNQLDSAIKFLHKALEIDSNYHSALENLGVAHAVKQDYKTAIEYLLKANQIAPDDQSIIKNLVNVYRNSGNSTKAKEWEEKIKDN